MREQVRLQVGNLLDPALLANEPTYNFVFCRNLLIYFDQPTQKQVFDVLKALTHVDGVLFIGPAEGSLLGHHGMRSIGVPQSFALSRHVEPTPPAAPVVTPTPAPILQRRAVAIPLKPRPFSTASTASTQVQPVKVEHTEAGDLLSQIATLANEGKSAEARAACRYLSSPPPAA